MKFPVVRLAEWGADTLRFVHAAFYWNWRKWKFRRRGATGGCPCQNPSDEAKLGLVRCDVVLLWNQPARFRPLCPLLVHTPEGWRCSVPAKEVRPFWGRAFGIVGLTLVGLYAVLSFSVFATLRWGNDLPIRYTDLAWPGHWNRVRIAQSNRLFVQAIAAFQRGELNKAFLALTSARERYPANYDAGIFIAQISMFQGSYAFADGLFEQLQREEPSHAYRTAVVYHDTLLMLQRYERLAEHALAMARNDPGHAALWVRSLLFALRAGNFSATFLPAQRERISELAPHAQLLIAAEGEIAANQTLAAKGRLGRAFTGPLNPFYMEAQVERLSSLGDRRTAQALLDAYGPLLGEFRHLLAQLRLELGNADDFGARATFRGLLAVARTRDELAFLVTALIESPHADYYRQLAAHLRERPELLAQADGPSMWVAALLCGARDEAVEWKKLGYQPGSPYPAIEQLDFSIHELSNPRSAIGLVNVLTFPREVVMTLLMKAPPRDRVDALPRWAPPPTTRGN